jgi:Terminase large subunit, T4likevirus-type, N-terminal
MTFAQLISPMAFAIALGFAPEPIQAQVLSTRTQNLLLVAPRQYGKTTLAVLRILWLALTKPNSLILISSPSEHQSGEVLDRLAPYILKLGMRWQGDGIHHHSLVLPNGSRIVGLSENPRRIRGFSHVDMIVIDEAAYVDDRVYRALLPMLSVSNGDIWLISTPHRKLGFFHDIYHAGGDQWIRIHATLQDSRHHNQELIERQRLELGDEWFRQEYMAEFTNQGQGMFTLEMIEACFSDEVEELDICF